MRIRFLGTTGYHPTENRHTSCIALPDQNIVFDAGTGFFRLREHIGPGRLDILLSHYHLDHICGLQYLIDVVHEKEVKEVHIWGPPGLDQLERLFQPPFFPLPLDQFPVKVKLHTIDKKKTFSFRGHRVKTQLFPHDETGSLGYRLNTDGKTLVYITDTIANPEDVALSKNADLLLHECYFRNSFEDRAIQTGHSFSSLVGRYAAIAKASRLALIHINPLDPEPEFCLREVMEHFLGAFLVVDNQEIDL